MIECKPEVIISVRIIWSLENVTKLQFDKETIDEMNVDETRESHETLQHNH